MVEEQFCQINLKGDQHTPYFNILIETEFFWVQFTKYNPKNTIFFNISIITIKNFMPEEKFCQIN